MCIRHRINNIDFRRHLLKQVIIIGFTERHRRYNFHFSVCNVITVNLMLRSTENSYKERVRCDSESLYMQQVKQHRVDNYFAQI
jgi:hypothetical protein